MRIEGDDDMNPDWMELVIEAGLSRLRIADCGLRIRGIADCGLKLETVAKARAPETAPRKTELMNQIEMKQRTKAFALRIIKAVEALPRARTGEVLGKQLLRCGTSVGANYRAACRARSSADFIAKMGIVEEEADETIYWMELLVEAGFVKAAKLKLLMQEADELVAIAVASINTTRGRTR
jgi:four helix bundle protein